jgi:hypothetical protein
MIKPAPENLSAPAESSWLMMRDGTQLELHGQELRVTFEFEEDKDFLIRLRAAGQTSTGAIATVSLKLGDLLELFARHCETAEFVRSGYDEAFIYASSQARDPYDTGRVNDLSRIQTERNRDKFSRELRAIEQTASKLDSALERINSLAARYEESSFAKRNL